MLKEVDAVGTPALWYVDDRFSVRAEFMDMAATVRQQSERLVFVLHRSGVFIESL
jgi:hypothetical protein